MTTLLERLRVAAVATVTGADPATGRAGVGAAMRKSLALDAAWSAWESGTFASARALCEELVAQEETCDAAHHILALVAHVTGDHKAAIVHHQQIRPRYRWLGHLDEPVLWSHVHGGDLEAARRFAEVRRLPRATLKRLDLAIRRPLSLELHGTASLPFTDDPLSPYMPGVSASLCGHSTIVRLDTGGAFLHLSASQAEVFGIQTIACERAFASLTTGKICFGVADELVLGNAILRNVPVAVHHGALSTQGIRDALGVEVGPIIGTNILQRFMTTIDGPGKRILLSSRRDEASRARHHALLSKTHAQTFEIPFAMLHDHFMIARGSAGNIPTLFFVDSGLVVFNTEQGQAAVLAPQSTLDGWGAVSTGPGRFPELAEPLALDAAARFRLAAFTVTDRLWRRFGDWAGLKVQALLSWGFLSYYCWTIDFDRYTYSLVEPEAAE